ncbi:hypothetical protein B0H13DRAFT_2688899 [Mycena leptocephala]|nr:hypothetical protein B0H13DRAFT_2688899 [Mycena leptocephala]
MEAGSMSTSTDTIRTLHTRQPSPSRSPSPSPPDSPSLSASGSSVSSFPSVSSSFFFSSAAASPPHVPPLEENHGQLIIPELMLPAAHVVPRTSNLKVELKQEEGKVNGPTTRLLVLGPRGAAAAALCLDNSDGWVEEDDGLSVLRAEAAWRDDVHDKSSGSLELVSLGEDVHQLSLPTTTHRILTPFRAIGALLAPPVLSSPDREKEEKVLKGMLEGVGVPIYRALVVVLPSADAPATTNEAETVSMTVDSSSMATATSNEPQANPLSPHAEVDRPIEIPETLRALVPVVFLAPPSPSAFSRPPSPAPKASRSDADAEEDEDPNDFDTTLTLDAEGEGAPPTARLPPLPPRPSHAEREPTVTYPPAAPAPAPVPSPSKSTGPNTSPNPNPNMGANTSGRSDTYAYTPSALRRLLGLEPASHAPKAQAEAGEQGQERNLHAESAALFVAWWRAGGGGDGGGLSYEDEPEPVYRHLEQHERGRRRCIDEHPQHNDHLEVPLPRLAVHLAPPQGEKTHHSPYPLHSAYSPYAPYSHAHRANADPLHFPSVLALLGGVVRAWASPSSRWGGDNSRRGVGVGGGGWGWTRVGTFVAGVLVGVGVGVWVCA